MLLYYSNLNILNYFFKNKTKTNDRFLLYEHLVAHCPSWGTERHILPGGRPFITFRHIHLRVSWLKTGTSAKTHTAQQPDTHINIQTCTEHFVPHTSWVWLQF